MEQLGKTYKQMYERLHECYEQSRKEINEELRQLRELLQSREQVEETTADQAQESTTSEDPLDSAGNPEVCVARPKASKASTPSRSEATDYDSQDDISGPDPDSTAGQKRHLSHTASSASASSVQQPKRPRHSYESKWRTPTWFTVLYPEMPPWPEEMWKAG
ncbi:hypothetical protein BO78DRAFT_418640 [Aspergillus sclerotiicarbonarius CBS 121057]|uniref:Uncharacterized protein n=1 Tax=Aspergillus sclerotiicarbonarius (strain CBS 121057 / IBT 28362) TaxID=1448318 RepID=A0A319E8K8_ASPSB|nr:hypothetical protein BO78DRAFT_418640 [Aspergillus sclerotiicarbonarius CBS 121057]